MADLPFETRTLEQLTPLTSLSPEALTAVQEPGGPVGRVSIKQLLGRLVQTDTAKETRADLLAELDHDEPAVGLVFADPDPAKNGWYRKTGASGAGTWTQFEKLSAFAAAEIAEYVAQAVDSADVATGARDAAQALINFRKTLADGIADFAVGEFFSTAETGELRAYERIAITPYYQDLGDGAAPLTRSRLGSDAGATDVQLKRAAVHSRRRPVSEWIEEQLLTPENFRQPGDTVLLRLERFVAALGNGVHGRLDADYVIPSMIVISNKSKFKIYGMGYTIKLANGAATGYGGGAVYIVQCSDFEIVDLIFDGNRANRVVAEDAAHLVTIDKSHRWKLTRVQANNGTCDGFIINAGSVGNGSGPAGAIAPADCPSHWLMEECEALNNWRQGLSIIEGFFGKVRRGRYGLTTGAWDTHAGPCAGIDIEPDHHDTWVQNRVANIDIDDVLFDQNQGAGLLITNVDGVENIRVRNCVFDRNRKAAIETFAENVDIIDCQIMGFNTVDFTDNVAAPPKRGVIDVGVGAGRTRIVGPMFSNISNSGVGNANPCIYTHGGAAAGIAVSGVRSDGTASDIASLNSPNVMLCDSLIDVSAAPEGTHLTFGGNYPQMSNVTMIGVYQRAAYFGGLRPRIRDNTFMVRVADHTAYVVAANDCVQPEVARNRIEHAVDVETYGFGIANEAIILDNWVVNNLSTDAFIITGTPLMKRGNLRFGNKQSETAITP